MGARSRVATCLALLFAVFAPATWPTPVHAAESPASGSEAAFGDWLTGNGKAVVRITRCGAELCGAIVWLRNEAASGQPVRNAYGLPLMGAAILEGFKEAGAGWRNGRVHALDRARTYRARLATIDPDHLRLEGCYGPFCSAQIWTRVQLGPAGPRPVGKTQLSRAQNR